MSYAGILATVNLYKTQKNDLTSDLSDILMNITDASRQSSTLMQQENEDKSYLREKYTTTQGEKEDDTTYELRKSKADAELKDGMDEIESEFECQLEKISTWEAELEFQKQTKETEVQVTSSYLDSFTEVLKNNVKKDFTYGQSK